MKRRKFIQHSAVAATGSLLMPSLLGCKPAKQENKKTLGLQLYTLRDVILKDLQGTLKAVADIGYTEMETFSYGDGKIFGQPFNEYVKITNDLGLKTVSGHYMSGFNLQSSGNLRSGWEQAVADAKSAGQEYMIIAYLFKEERETIDQYKELCELINKGAEVCKSYGIKMGYHNHDFEFVAINNEVPYDVMLAELDPTLVSMELDLYWIVRAGFSPADYFARHPGRFELWHVKDMHKDDPTKNADLGTGSINFAEIFKLRQQSGLKHFFVEQETYDVSSLESVKNNYNYLKEIV
ncbi:MAG: sugar phosphate isomerase/epimerase [Flammeovirgaceae bacterium]|nr:MAG: sugar phosphate isomerase/epimerase [Flammeovirgaceae bacterium]